MRYSANDLLVALFLEFRLEAAFPPHGQPKIDELDVIGILGEKEEVFGLEIAVGNLEEVQIVDALEHLPEDDPRIFFVERALLVQPVE